MAIRSFKGKDADAVFRGKKVRRFQAFQDAAERRLQVLENATTLNDLRKLPGNRFEALGGDRRGQYSIRINDQWRICFTWTSDETVADGTDAMLVGGNAENVEIVDYHQIKARH